MKIYHILTINPGSTSTKIGVFRNDECLFEINVSHSPKQLEEYSNIWDQYTFRKLELISALEEKNFPLSKLDAVVGRGGLIKPIPSGTYLVDQEMIEDARNGYQGHHASNLGCAIAYSIAWEYSVPAYIVDPPAVNDLEPLAKISGHKDYERSSLLHALNIFATARNYAEKLNKKIEELNLIVAHMGGGVTVAALKEGKAINVNNGLYEGPFSPERSGDLPMFKFMKTCLSGDYTEAELKKMIVGKGGFVSYFNTNDAREVENMAIAGSEKYKLVYEAMGYQVAEEIGKRATNLMGKVDAILLTGGIAYSEILNEWIKDRVSFISEVHVFPGEVELEALAKGGLRVLRGEERAKLYTPHVKKVGIIYWDNPDVNVKAVDVIEEKLTNSGFNFRKGCNNMEIIYINCQRKEENVMRAVEKFKHKEVDLIFAIGSSISFRLGQCLKNDDIPVVFAGIYSPLLIADFEKEHNNYHYATCFSPKIEDQFKNTILKIHPKIKEIGVLFSRGELQAEIHYDNIKAFCKKNNIKINGYEIQSTENYEKAMQYFSQKKIDWIYMGIGTIVADSTNENLSPITSSFSTLCTQEETVIKGGLITYIHPWEEVCSAAVDIALSIFDEKKVKSRVYMPKKSQIIINEDTAKKLKVKEKLKTLKNTKFV